ncbi:ROK family protein [Mangrovicoccus algicola]|uniref:ROK family transcriptional regulator n=1 Tax=Mangrovicoccus algicola TaxID=2771008 RepID=A0A8J7CYJ4_9RHOB|nr:ROK family transcriptional regulator [Mangrovicoccus algicola]MBE3639642.1 ROK family transcriptional regulator [Mangrovicoccus algicola]
MNSVMRLLVQGARSRSDLARETGLSKQTVSEVMRTLEDLGWVRNIGTRAGGMGRSAVLYEVEGRAGMVLGMDIGASRFRIELCDARGTALASREMRTEHLRGDRLLAEILGYSRDTIAEFGGGRVLRLACLATPGVVHPGTGHLTRVSALPALSGIDLAGALEQGLGCTALVENDMNAAILGERWTGSARDLDDVAYIGLGTGVGQGLIVGGRLLRGATGAAGEVASLPIGADSLEPDSVRRGALERVLGLQAILAAYHDPAGTSAGLAAFTRALEAQEPEALEVLSRIGCLSGQLILSVQAMLDPQAVVMGGMLGLVPGVVEAARDGLARRSSRPVPVLPAGLGLRSTVTGACYLALTGMYNQTFAPQLETRSLDQPWPLPPPVRQAGTGGAIPLRAGAV